MTSAKSVHHCRHDERRSQEVADLQSDVIVAVAESWQLHDARVVCSFRAEHLSEDGMRNRHV